MSLEKLICEKAEKDGLYAIAWALLELNVTQKKLVKEINALGFKDADTPLGALEHLSEEVKGVAEALSEIGRSL